MSMSGISSLPTASTNNVRAEFERLRQTHEQEGPDVAGRKRHLRSNDDGPSAAAKALASAAPDPNAAQAPSAPGGRVNLTA